MKEKQLEVITYGDCIFEALRQQDYNDLSKEEPENAADNDDDGEVIPQVFQNS